jgi:hypothetical protein
MDDPGRNLRPYPIGIVVVNESRIEYFRQIIGLEVEAQGVNGNMVLQH